MLQIRYQCWKIVPEKCSKRKRAPDFSRTRPYASLYRAALHHVEDLAADGAAALLAEAVAVRCLHYPVFRQPLEGVLHEALRDLPR